MRHILTEIIAATLVATITGIPTFEEVDRTTAQRIAEYDYPAETHQVHTTDGYILTVFRIPYSPKLQNKDKYRPVAFLQHGLLSSSDGWILNGPDDALAYLLADAGYDVWLGNARGNTYSKQHESLSTSQRSFWDFSWHEIGLFDISATIDYMLDTTNDTGIHYVGHSMGCTVLFVLTSLLPEYNDKFKTAHMLAPVAYGSNERSPLATVPAPILGHHPISDLFQNIEILPHVTSTAWLASLACSNELQFQALCVDVVNFLFGWNSAHFNTTLLPDFLQTHPAGTSTTLYTHFEQEYVSGKFQWYDHGFFGNLARYTQKSPPEYDVSKIVAPLRIYYSDNDPLADEIDVQKLVSLLPNVVENYHVPYPDWNHVDFLFGLEVKDTINDRIISAANNFETTGVP